MAEIDVPDLNLWLALADPDHEHHARARHYWEAEAAAQTAFCRVTMLGFLRLLTDSHAMHGAALTASAAWEAYDAFASLPEVCFLADSVSIERQFAAWTRQENFVAHRWTDAWIAATARASDARVVSFDSDFEIFPGLSFLRLRP